MSLTFSTLRCDDPSEVGPVTSLAQRHPPRRIALVTQGFGVGGGIPSAVRWLRDGLESLGGYSVDIHDLAASSRDVNSRRAARPTSWGRRSLRGPYDGLLRSHPWGANLVEIEPMRYRPRSELTRVVEEYDLVQVVAGAPALATAVTRAAVPVVIQVATSVRWERQATRVGAASGRRLWRDAMTGWATRAELDALRRADAVQVMNDAMLAFVVEAGQPNVVKAPPGVDTNRFVPPTAPWSPGGYLLSVCRLSEPRKRLDRLILTYRELVNFDDDVPALVLAGKGDLPAPVRDLIVTLDLESRVVIRQEVRPEELAALYRGASVYVQASQEEGLGLSVLEAMACGVPVVATDTDGSRECVADAVTGWLVAQTPEPGIPHVFAERIRDILRVSGPSMALAGRLRCEQLFSTKVALGQITDLYERILGSA